MAITYANKNAAAPEGTPEHQWRAVDANEVKAEVNGHLANVSNPHSTTKAQVGLGNADDTSDVNKPISTAMQAALDAKANAIVLAAMGATTWNLGTQPFVEKTISGNTSFTLTGGTNGASSGILIIDNTGSWTITINGVPHDIRNNDKTAISAIKLSDGTYYVRSDYNGVVVPDTTPPTVVSAIATTTTNIRIVFSEATNATLLGWSFKKNGGALAASAITQVNATTWDFTVGAMIDTDTILRSYDDTTGDTEDLAANELESFTDEAVTNSIGDLTAPTVVSATAIDATHIEVVFSEVVTATNVGWSFKKNGGAHNPSGVTGSGTTTLTFTVPSMINTDTILRSYNDATGDTEDGSGNELASFTDQAVTNSIGGGSTMLEDKTWDDLTGWTNLHSGGNAAAEIAVIDGVNKLHQSNVEGGGYNVIGKAITGWVAGDILRISIYGFKLILGTGNKIEITNHLGTGGLLGGGLDYISADLAAGDSTFDVDTTGFTCNIFDIKSGPANSDLAMRQITIEKL